MERLGDILPRAVLKPAKRSKSAIARARKKWLKVAGKELSQHASPKSVRRGVLIVEVDSSALLAELASFRKKELLEGLVADPEPLGIRNMKFVLEENA